MTPDLMTLTRSRRTLTRSRSSFEKGKGLPVLLKYKMVLGAAFFVTVSSTAMAGQLFVSAHQAKDVIGQKNVVILDARAEEGEYKKGHLPGAQWVAWEWFANTRGKPGLGWGVSLPKKQLAQQIGKLGISKESRVIIYVDPQSGWGEDGRFLWMLQMIGVKCSQILDGGIRAWKARGYPLTKRVSKPKPVSFEITQFHSNLTADTTWIVGHRETVKLVDSRKRSEFDGAREFGEARGGHLPGAIHFYFRKVFAADGTLKSDAELGALLEKAGLQRKDSIAVYCTAGIRSAHLTMVLRKLGFHKARNYDESFYHWAADKSRKVR
jgi:thiosulfate/3-mercaptopyruvate sulfurtransferase